MKKVYLVMVAIGGTTAQLKIPLTQQQIDLLDVFYAENSGRRTIQGPGLLTDFSAQQPPYGLSVRKVEKVTDAVQGK